MPDTNSADMAQGCLQDAANCIWEPNLSGHASEHAFALLRVEQAKAHAMLAIAESIDNLAAAVSGEGSPGQHPLTDAVRDASHFLAEVIERGRA